MNAAGEHQRADEIGKFDQLGDAWWHRDGEFKTLHDINPLRLRLIEEYAPLDRRAVVDVGCGGGILSEAMARAGARVTGIDLSAPAIEAARAHAHEHGLTVDYRCEDAATLLARAAGTFDAVVCMELLEHVPDPVALVAECGALAAPGATVFFSTLNRTARAYLQAILGAEYLLRLLPRGTHSYARFIRPGELAAWARAAGLESVRTAGLQYNPFDGRCRLIDDLGVNYFLVCRKPRDD